MGIFSKRKSADDSPEEDVVARETAIDGGPQKSFKEAILPVMACGAGLFSDGYINNVSIDLLQLNK